MDQFAMRYALSCRTCIFQVLSWRCFSWSSLCSWQAPHCLNYMHDIQWLVPWNQVSRSYFGSRNHPDKNQSSSAWQSTFDTPHGFPSGEGMQEEWNSQGEPQLHTRTASTSKSATLVAAPSKDSLRLEQCWYRAHTKLHWISQCFYFILIISCHSEQPMPSFNRNSA